MGYSFAFMMLVFLVGIPVLLFVVFVFYVIMKLLGGSDGNRQGMTRDEEARLIQEIHQGLTRMEKRVEALETIVIDREGKQES